MRCSSARAPYAALLVYTELGWPPIAGAPLGVAVSAALAIVVGTPTFRLRGHYFSMATIAAAELIRILVSNWPFLGAAVGLMGPPVPRSALDLSFTSPRALSLSVPRRSRVAAPRHVVDAAEPHGLLSRAPSGAATVRRAVSACRSCATSSTRSCCLPAFTSLAGTLYAVMIGFVDPDSGFGILLSVKMVIVAALGGAGTLFGPLAGAIDPGPARGSDQRHIRRRRHRPHLHHLRRHHHADRPVRARRHGRDVAASFGPSGAAVLLEARGVVKAFGAFRAVDGADLAVDEGEIVGLIGPNGAGKSTFFNCVAGDFAPTDGTIAFRGQDVTRATPRRTPGSAWRAPSRFRSRSRR